ncbi:hypothetical protein CCACVL1_27456 [Corchorus capsularis]|uniref:Uncharacterized protein n=1 Tax=Corchorus capsularis TaxID=210143 RepID=A0A1R3GA61_COCAP|nr:hypothetical protein CCACVL1_27456 [Corchorus capsularis]
MASKFLGFGKTERRENYLKEDSSPAHPLHVSPLVEEEKAGR